MEKVHDETQIKISTSSIVILETPDISAKSITTDNTVMLNSIDETASSCNLTSDQSYFDVENTSAKDTTDTEKVSSMMNPKIATNVCQSTSVGYTAQPKITMYAEIHKESMSPEYQPSVFLTDCRNICSSISMDSIDGADKMGIAGKCTYSSCKHVKCMSYNVNFYQCMKSLTDTIQDYLDISDNTSDGFNADGYDISEYLVENHFACNTLCNH